MKGPLFEAYVKACDYPGALDEAAVNAALGEYCRTLGITRKVERLTSDILSHADFARTAREVAADVVARVEAREGKKVAALDARDARDALDALDARAARAALDARDARDALDARDARDALDARAARDARDALDARDARDARAARAARDARAARAARDARDALDALKRFAQWCALGAYYWYRWDLSWNCSYFFGSDDKPKVAVWARPLLDAFVAGAWFLTWTDNTLYWVAKPTVHVEVARGMRRLHCADGPALACDVENLYFWHGQLVPAYAIVCPDQITVKEIREEANAETRRSLIELMTPQRYLWESGAKLIDTDHEKARRGAAPRALLRDDQGDQWLVGTDGGTKRVYYMPVSGEVKTCREAHESICGFDETKILSKS